MSLFFSNFVPRPGTYLFSRNTVPGRILLKMLKEDCSLRASRDGHIRSSSMSPTLLVFLNRMQVHLAVVL